MAVELRVGAFAPASFALQLTTCFPCCCSGTPPHQYRLDTEIGSGCVARWLFRLVGVTLAQRLVTQRLETQSETKQALSFEPNRLPSFGALVLRRVWCFLCVLTCKLGAWFLSLVRIALATEPTPTCCFVPLCLFVRAS